MAARLSGLLNPILRSHTVYASSLNNSTTLEGFSNRCSVEDAQLAEYQNRQVYKQRFDAHARLKSQQEQSKRDRCIYIITPKKSRRCCAVRHFFLLLTL